MEKAIDSVKSDEPSIKKINKSALKKKISKIEKLVKLYKQLREAIMKLENREVSFGEDYNEEFEEACNRRLLKLMQKRLQIHNYLIRKGIFVSDAGETIFPDTRPKLIITSTGIEDLNILLTEYVNQETDSNVLGCKIRIPYKHVTVNDVKMMIDKLKETNTQLLRDVPLDLDQFVQNITCEVNKLVKRFIEDNHRMGLDDWMISGQTNESVNSPSTSADENIPKDKEEQSLSIPTWDIANMELHEACDRGELDCHESENNDDIDDTEMSPTADEEEEDGERYEADTQCSIDASVRTNGDSENRNIESDDSCCIVEERVHERSVENDDSDCCIIEDNEVSNETNVNENIENMDAHSANDAENPSKNEKKNIELDGEIVKDDECCIVED